MQGTLLRAVTAHGMGIVLGLCSKHGLLLPANPIASLGQAALEALALLPLE